MVLPNKTGIWAHRGMGLLSAEKYHIPPNSLAAFEWTAKLGIDGFETDICLTKDEEPIIYHPGTLEPNPQLESWIATQWHQPDILHLKDLLNFLAGNPSIDCLLHIKENSSLLIEKIVTEVGKARLCDQVFLTTSSQQSKLAGLTIDGNWLKYAKNIDPQIGIHVIDILPFNILKTAKEFRADIISFGWLNDSFISRVVFELIFYKKILRQLVKRKSSLKIFGGITQTLKQMQHLLDCTDNLIDGIITDDPEATLEYLNTRPR